MAKTRRMRLPNGRGTIRHLKGKRRNEYQVLGPTVYDALGREKRPIIGYTDSWHNGYRMLLDYHDNPYDLDYSNSTLIEIIEELKILLLKEYETQEMSKSNYRNLIGSIKYLSLIYKRKLLEIRTKELQDIIDNSGLGYTTRGYIKNLCGRLDRYCTVDLELPIKFKSSNLKIGKREKSTLHSPLSDNQVKNLWSIEGKNIFIDIMLFSIYTGLRPSEALNIEIKNVYIEKNYAIGGSKTKAGRNRLIPFHNAILPIVKRYYDKNNNYLFINPITNNKLGLDTYRSHIQNELSTLGINNVTPYDTRHTFATKADEVGISETNIKVLMGHSLSGDVTNAVYIHKSKELLINEVNKIYFIEKGVK